MLMNRTPQNKKCRAEESGQAAVFLVLAMGLFLIGSMQTSGSTASRLKPQPTRHALRAR